MRVTGVSNSLQLFVNFSNYFTILGGLPLAYLRKLQTEYQKQLLFIQLRISKLVNA